MAGGEFDGAGKAFIWRRVFDDLETTRRENGLGGAIGGADGELEHGVERRGGLGDVIA